MPISLTADIPTRTWATFSNAHIWTCNFCGIWQSCNYANNYETTTLSLVRLKTLAPGLMHGDGRKSNHRQQHQLGKHKPTSLGRISYMASSHPNGKFNRLPMTLIKETHPQPPPGQWTSSVLYSNMHANSGITGTGFYINDNPTG